AQSGNGGSAIWRCLIYFNLHTLSCSDLSSALPHHPSISEKISGGDLPLPLNAKPHDAYPQKSLKSSPRYTLVNLRVRQSLTVLLGGGLASRVPSSQVLPWLLDIAVSWSHHYRFHSLW